MTRPIFLLCMIFVITACSDSNGNGSTDDAPLAPSVTLDVGLKQLQFGWAPVSDATSYRVFENPDGASGFTQIGDDLPESQTAFNHDVAVHLHDWDNALYRVEACNGAGCTASDSVDAAGNASEAIAYFKASNADPGDRFAYGAVSGDGRTFVVATWEEASAATGIGGDQTDNSADGAGAAYVFARDETGDWSQQAYIKASNAEAGDNFGLWAALSDDGNTLAMGATGESGAATGINGDETDNSAPSSGAVYVFVRDSAGEWSQQAYIKASNAEAYDLFGVAPSLSADGSTLAVSAQEERGGIPGVNGNDEDNSADSAGATYVFVRDEAGDWSQQAYIKASNPETGDRFGWNTALSSDGDTLAVSAYQEDSAATGIDGNQDDNNATDAGAVYVFTRDGGVWSQQAYVKASNTDAGDEFTRLDLSGDGNTLAVGACKEDSAAAGIDSDQDGNSAADAGAVYLFSRDAAGDWSPQAYLKASNTDAGDGFCIPSLTGDGNTLLVAAPGESSGATGINGDQLDNSTADAGAGYLFTRDDSGTWSQQAYLKSPNTDAGDLILFHGISDDGATLLAGAPAESSAATGIGGDQADNSAAEAGAVYLY